MRRGKIETIVFQSLLNTLRSQMKTHDAGSVTIGCLSHPWLSTILVVVFYCAFRLHSNLLNPFGTHFCKSSYAQLIITTLVYFDQHFAQQRDAVGPVNARPPCSQAMGYQTAISSTNSPANPWLNVKTSNLSAQLSSVQSPTHTYTHTCGF